MSILYLTILLAVLLYMTVWFLLALWRRRNDLADIAWGGGFIVAALTALLLQTGLTPRAKLVVLLVILWGLRLAVHIGLRNLGKGEDERYRKWREEWGRHWLLRSYLQVFLLQGFLLYLISLPVIWTILVKPSPWTGLDAIGLAVWIVGFFFEALGDFQLARFKKDPNNRGKIIQQGLWRYSRHPNYFGEVTLWWGIYLLALSTPGGWMTIIGPLTITFLILKVSGIPLLEKKYVNNAAFQEYARRTSAFFPIPPRKDG
jgi:steroid 5-alpha reductase family enzyme